MPFFIDPPPPPRSCAWALARSPGVDITLLMTQGNSVGVIHLGLRRTDPARLMRLGTPDTSPLARRERARDWRAACRSRRLCVCGQ